jgi:undecaprenyl-diphosphatase
VSVAVVILAAGEPSALLGFVIATALALVLQCHLKRRLGRPRPCQRPDGPPQRVPIPDHGSFPSGHSLHAAMAAVVVAWQAPLLAPAFALVALLIATSRVVLGVHYPSDVVAGAALGVILGLALTLWAG